jgi:hypothetical protein
VAEPLGRSRAFGGFSFRPYYDEIVAEQPDPAGLSAGVFMITKDLYSYSIIFLRQEKILRAHDRAGWRGRLGRPEWPEWPEP